MSRKPVVLPRALNILSRPSHRRGRFTDRLVLTAHGLAVKLDCVPGEFGDLRPVDETDPAAVREEWLRQAKLWADYNSEAIFALKAGALMLGIGLGAVLMLVAVL